MGELVRTQLVNAYRVEGKMFGFFKTWDKHQRIRAQHSKYPPPSSDNICQQMTADVPVVVVESRILPRSEKRELVNGHRADPALSPAADVLRFLNLKAQRTFRDSDANLSLIRSRLSEGIAAWQLKAIVSRKCREWGADPKMSPYLRPATLFNKTKCEQYLGELPPPSEEEPDV